MSDPQFIREYRAIYESMRIQLSGHLGQCKADECKAFGDGFAAAFEMLPKPPPGRKQRKK